MGGKISILTHLEPRALQPQDLNPTPYSLRTSEIMLVSHLFADGDTDLPIMTIVRLATWFLLMFMVWICGSGFRAYVRGSGL